jgi:spermidine/putrescine transport system permease protein
MTSRLSVLMERREWASLALVKSFVQGSSSLRIGLILGLPSLLLVLFFFIPLLSMVRLSFLENLPPAPYTLSNYIEVFTSEIYIGILRQTTLITILTTVLVIVLGYSFAYSIVRWSKRTTYLLLLLILPFWTNYIVRMYAWINILQQNGVVNWLEVTLGLTNDPSGYLYSFNAVVLGLVYVWLPLATLPFYASIEGMDESLIEAGKDLGAGPIKTFWTVTLPQTKNGVLAGITLVAIPTFGSFVTPALLGGTNILMLGQVIDTQFNQAFDWPFGAALGTVVVVGVFVVIGLTQLAGHSAIGSRGGESP